MIAARFQACLLVMLTQVGCAATSGQDWLNTPIEEQTAASATDVNVPAPSESESRPRLRRAITLGESYAGSVATAERSAPGAASVQVNVSTYVPVTVNNYGGGYTSDYSVVAPSRASTGTTLQPGQDFPSPPSYGPAFPYHAGPASPWAR